MARRAQRLLSNSVVAVAAVAVVAVAAASDPGLGRDQAPFWACSPTRIA